jgi:hypothetical protein
MIAWGLAVPPSLLSAESKPGRPYVKLTPLPPEYVPHLWPPRLASLQGHYQHQQSRPLHATVHSKEKTCAQSSASVTKPTTHWNSSAPILYLRTPQPPGSRSWSYNQWVSSRVDVARVGALASCVGPSVKCCLLGLNICDNSLTHI